MALAYGFVKARIVSPPLLKATRRQHETQYHEHFGVRVNGAHWDTAINVGTNDSDDLLKYRLIFDFQHDLRDKLRAMAPGFHDLTGSTDAASARLPPQRRPQRDRATGATAT